MPDATIDGGHPGDFVVVNASHQQVRRETATRWATQLHGLEGAAALTATADITNQLAQCHTKRHFDQARVLDGAGEGEGLGPTAAGGPDPGKPSRPLQEDAGDATVGFDVVNVGRAAPQPDALRDTEGASAACRAGPRWSGSRPFLRRRQRRRPLP